MKVKSFAAKKYNLRLARTYGLLAFACLVAGVHFGKYATWLLWPAFALTTMSAAYLALGPRVFRKQNGRLPMTTQVILAPFLFGSWLGHRWLARRNPAWATVAPNVLVGRKLSPAEAGQMINNGVVAVLDVTSEFSETKPFRSLPYLNLQLLDHTAPTTAQLAQGTAFIREHARHGTVYVHCALGYSRSVALVAAYLLHENLAANVAEAIEKIGAHRTCARVTDRLRAALEEFHTTQCNRCRLIA